MGDTKRPAEPGTVLSQMINGAPAETLPRMLLCPMVHAVTSTQDACPGLLALYYKLLSYSPRSLLRSSPGKQSPLCLLSLESLSSFAVVADSRAISFMAAITCKASVKRKQPWIGSQPASGSITVLAIMSWEDLVSHFSSLNVQLYSAIIRKPSSASLKTTLQLAP